MGKSKSKLAILGGKKIFNKPGPHYIWPKINKKIEKVVIDQLYQNVSIYNRSGIFEKFEDSFACYHDRKYALLCNSGTTAIHSMFVASDLGPNDEVICPAYTFFATVSPLLFTGARPILCDCDENGNIDPKEIEKKITRKTKALIITHMWGVPCQMDKIVEICKKNNILLFEDCSHAHGATYQGKKLGSFGDMAAWSLQGAKNVSGGEGGVLATNNDELYYKALLLGHYNKRCKQEMPNNHKFYQFATTGMGLKYRAHPLAISIAMEMFENLEKNILVRESYAQKIISELSFCYGLLAPKILENNQSSWYALVFQYQQDEFQGLTIEKFYNSLHAEGLLEVDRPGSTSPLNLLALFQRPQELFPIYRNKPFSYKKNDFPKAEKFYKNAIKLPVWADIGDKAIVETYIKGIKKVINNYKYLL